MEEKALTVFKKHCNEYLITETTKLPLLLQELGISPKLAHYFTAHIKTELMTISQFITIIKKMESLQDQIEKFLDKFGTDKTITLQDLVSILEKKGEKFSLSEVQKFFNESDMDKDGVVGLQDLLKIIQPSEK
ncbi:EF-hand domain pair-containing protein [Spironucleus salmonicida]|uniref:EF-hand domain pair-containing protein n=1 Tax=Spironucleus salmonicida TaxID=348837 RepID=V6LU14_9EUKA|nr:EF-hand domain pair-containing protein [Spironucleus salmonicida]|eukprot:EST47723.1 Hypothetical protein SS50377_12121 [Spironucleus salmonicida]